MVDYVERNIRPHTNYNAKVRNLGLFSPINLATK